MDMHDPTVQPLHNLAKAEEIRFIRGIEVNRNMDVRHSQSFGACALVRQCAFMRMQAEIDDVLYAKFGKPSQLVFVRLT